MMSSENLSFIYNMNTSPPNERNPLQYASTDKNKKSHYNSKIYDTSTPFAAIKNPIIAPPYLCLLIAGD